jgi:hypothetical protein
LPLYTRILSTTDYGIFDLLIIFGNFVNVIVAFEISQSIYRFYHEKKNKKKYCSTSLWFTVFAYIIFLGLTFTFSKEITFFFFARYDQIVIFNFAVIYITLNGIFKFNIGDEFTIIDNNTNSTVSLVFGRNTSPKTFKVLYKEEDTVNKWTKVYVATSFAISQSAPVDLNLRVVSRFSNCNWKSGIWTNGIYKKGLWEGGIWYNGVFEATWM